MDLTNPTFERVTLGMLRFSDANINKTIRDRHPDLYGHYSRTMVKKFGDEEKLRYDRQFRVNTYKDLIAYAGKIMPGVRIMLSTEAVSVWEDVGIEF